MTEKAKKMKKQGEFEIVDNKLCFTLVDNRKFEITIDNSISSTKVGELREVATNKVLQLRGPKNGMTFKYISEWLEISRNMYSMMYIFNLSKKNGKPFFVGYLKKPEIIEYSKAA